MLYDGTQNEEDDLILFFTDPEYRQSSYQHWLADVQRQTAEKGYAVSGAAIIIPNKGEEFAKRRKP